MKLIDHHSNSPLCYVNLQMHDPAKIQKKAAPSSTHGRGYKKHVPLIPNDEDMYDDDTYADDIGEESPPPASDHTARLNHASNVFRIKESRAEVHEKFKKSPWWSKVLCCQNIDIRHGQHELYMGQR